MEQARDRAVRAACRILRAGNPLSLTMVAKLDRFGVDVAELERTLANV